MKTEKNFHNENSKTYDKCVIACEFFYSCAEWEEKKT